MLSKPEDAQTTDLASNSVRANSVASRKKVRFVRIAIFRAVVKRTIEILREEGLFYLLERSVCSHSVSALWKNNLGKTISIPVPDALSLKIITSSEELPFGQQDISWYRLSVAECEKRLKKGAILFCAFIGGEIAHLSWVGTTRKTHGQFYSYSIDYDHEAELGGAVTAPKFRGRHVYTYVYSYIFHFLKEKGYMGAVFETNNDPVTKQIQDSLGSYIWGEGHNLRLLALSFRWIKAVKGV